MEQEEITTTNGTDVAQNGAEPPTPRKRKTARKKELFQFEVDTSPTAQAFMKAIRITQERLFPEKVKRAEAAHEERKRAEARRKKVKRA